MSNAGPWAKCSSYTSPVKRVSASRDRRRDIRDAEKRRDALLRRLDARAGRRAQSIERLLDRQQRRRQIQPRHRRYHACRTYLLDPPLAFPFPKSDPVLWRPLSIGWFKPVGCRWGNPVRTLAKNAPPALSNFTRGPFGTFATPGRRILASGPSPQGPPEENLPLGWRSRRSYPALGPFARSTNWRVAPRRKRCDTPTLLHEEPDRKPDIIFAKEASMGLANYEIIGTAGQWRVRHDGHAANVYETKESAFEAAVAAASLALRQGHEVRVSAPGSETATGAANAG